MKFGLFFNPMVPKPLDSDDWEPGQEKRVFDSMLEQVRFADTLGFDYVFLGEHHFTSEYAHNSATEVLLGALASTTTNIRLGTGITHMSHNDPIRAAERIATLDVISGGRAEFGMGAGTGGEVAPLMRGRAGEYRQVSAAASKIAAEVLGSRGVWPGVQNDYFDYPAVDVIPKSLQTPHPPLWTSATVPGMTAGIAERGLGALLLTLGGPDVVEAEVQAYWNRLKQPGVQPLGQGINPVVFAFASGLVAPTDELAQERAREGLEMFGFGLTGASVALIGDPTHHLHREFLDFKAGVRDTRLGAGVPEMMLRMGAMWADLPGMMLCGVDRARELTREIEATNVDGMLLNQQFGNTRHEHMMESIELWGTQIIPEFREREAEHLAWRKAQLAEVELPVVTSY